MLYFAHLSLTYNLVISCKYQIFNNNNNYIFAENSMWDDFFSKKNSPRVRVYSIFTIIEKSAILCLVHECLLKSTYDTKKSANFTKVPNKSSPVNFSYFHVML